MAEKKAEKECNVTVHSYVNAEFIFSHMTGQHEVNYTWLTQW